MISSVMQDTQRKRGGNIRRGSLLLEAIVAIAIFSVFLGGIGLTLMVGERTTVVGGDRSDATFIAERALEGVRSIANTNFSTLAEGSYGISATSTGWSLRSRPIVYGSGFVSKVQIVANGSQFPAACISPDCYEVLSTVNWNFGQTRSGSVLLRTYVANWHKVKNLGNWAGMSLVSKTTLPTSPPSFYGHIAISGNYAFVVGSSQSVAFDPRMHSRFYAWFQTVKQMLFPIAQAAYGGNGLYIYDISNLAAPVQVATSFSLGAEAYDIAIHGTGAYIITSDPVAELKVVDITHPTTPIIRSTLNMPGSGTGRVLAYIPTTQFDGDILFIGGTTGTVDAVRFNNNDASMSLLTSIAGLGGGVTGIVLNDGYAFVSLNSISAQMQVLSVIDATHSIDLQSGPLTFTGVSGGSALAFAGTGLILGRLQDLNNGAYEVNMMQIGDSLGYKTPTQLDGFDVGGSGVKGDVRTVAYTVDGKYAFIGSNNPNGQVRVVDVNKFSWGNQGLASIVYTYNAGPLEAMGSLTYDSSRNRLFGTSDTALYIFAPG